MVLRLLSEWYYKGGGSNTRQTHHCRGESCTKGHKQQQQQQQQQQQEFIREKGCKIEGRAEGDEPGDPGAGTRQVYRRVPCVCGALFSLLKFFLLVFKSIFKSI